MIPGTHVEDEHGRRAVLPPTLPVDTRVEVWTHRGLPGATQPICLLLDPEQALVLALELTRRARLIQSPPTAGLL